MLSLNLTLSVDKLAFFCEIDIFILFNQSYFLHSTYKEKFKIWYLFIFVVKIKCCYLKYKIYRYCLVEILCIYCSFFYYSITEHKNNDLHYGYMIPCQVTSDVNKEKTVAFLLKELDILRTSNKKV